MRTNNSYLDRTKNKFARSDLAGSDKNAVPEFDVWHETASKSRLDNSPATGTLEYNLGNPPGTSYTGLIARDGTYYPYVSRGYVAYHAGLYSSWLGKEGWFVNVYSNGYEIDGPNDGLPITEAQKQTIRELALLDWTELGIPLCSVWHPEHSEVAPKDPWGNIYKTDPKGINIDDLINPLGLQYMAGARCSEQTFAAVLKQYNSPAWPAAAELYAICLREGFDPAVALAFFVHESTAGTAGICAKYDTKNWGNVRSPYKAERAQVIDTYGGPFAKFQTWQEGLLDYIERLKYRYKDEWGLYTVELVIPKYAPSADGNSPANYIRAVRKMVALWEQAQEKLVEIPSVNGSPVLVPAEIEGYWKLSGEVWQPDRFALGLIIGQTAEKAAPNNRLYIFERGALRLKASGGIDGLLLPEAIGLLESR